MRDRDSPTGWNGCFVVFEGIDGAGTTTQTERYAAHLRARRRLAHTTREPSAGPVGSLIRQVLTHRVTIPTTNQAQIMALLFAADRLDHIQTEIAPFLRDGYVVISDRYDLSSLAYQAMTSSMEDAEPRSLAEWIRTLNRDAIRPDVTVVLDVAPNVAATRRRARGGPAELFDRTDLQVRLANAYENAGALVPSDRIVHIDGSGSIDAVAAQIVTALAPIVEP